MLLGYGYMRNNLVRLGGSLLFLFYVYMIKGDGALTEVSPFEAKWDEQKTILNTSSSPSRQKLCECVCTNSN